MKIINCEQGTDQWHETRRCMVTGTKMDSVVGTPWERLQLICELIAEEATEQIKVGRSTPEMERGTAEEPFARKAFEQRTGKKVTQLGFCISDEFPFLGVSGDGWIETQKNVYGEATEIKSPDTSTDVFYKLCNYFTPEELQLGSYSAITKVNPEPIFKPSAKAPFLGIPAVYKWQVVTYFLVNTDLKKLHFLVYDPRFINEDDRLFVVEVNRDDPEMLAALKEARESLISFREMWMRLRGAIIKDNF